MKSFLSLIEFQKNLILFRVVNSALSMSASVCYRCDKTGHFARECPDDRNSSAVCYRCDRIGHFARDCPEGEGEEREQVKRFDRNIVRERQLRDPREREYGSGGGLKCYVCKRIGHFARDCKEEEDRDKCYRCLASGHVARNCTQDGDQPTCYNCNKIGHILKDCPNAGTKTCYKCGGIGHILKECPSRV